MCLAESDETNNLESLILTQKQLFEQQKQPVLTSLGTFQQQSVPMSLGMFHHQSLVSTYQQRTAPKSVVMSTYQQQITPTTSLGALPFKQHGTDSLQFEQFLKTRAVAVGVQWKCIVNSACSL